MGTPAPYLSVVAPCFNERQTLPEFYRRVAAAARAVGRSHEIVLVNDGSRDGTWELMLELAAEHPAVVCVNLSRNHGHQLALTAGLAVCRGERVLILDADLQDPPELLSAMLARMDAPPGADVVYGQRRTRAGESRLKLATASLFYRLINRLAETPIPRDTGDFRLMSRRSLDVLLAMPERHRFVRGMVSWIGFRQEALLYDRDERYAGATKYPLRKMVRFAVDAVTSFSTRPLAWASKLGFAAALLGLLLVVYAVVGWMRGSTVAGWASQMATVALLGSVQLVVLGIFGEYLGRMYDQCKGRPLFVIERIVRSGAAGPEAGDFGVVPAVGTFAGAGNGRGIDAGARGGPADPPLVHVRRVAVLGPPDAASAAGDGPGESEERPEGRGRG